MTYDHFRRLLGGTVLLAALLFALAPKDAFAAHPYYETEAAAMAACEADKTARASQFYPHQIGPCVRGNGGQTLNCGGPWAGESCYLIEWRHTETGVVMWSGVGRVQASKCELATGATFQEWHQSSSWPPTGIGCRDYMGESCNTVLDVISEPLRSADGGYNYRVNVTMTGGPCSGTPESEPISEEDIGDGWKCDKETGLCTDPDGNGKLCTFNPDGSRSACVNYKPGDGTDPAPTDPEKPNDPRDEGSVSGGGSCSSAPGCSGDRIACATLWQQWKTRCAVEAMSGAVVGGLEDVKGAVEGVGSGSGGGGIGDGNCGAGDADCNGVADVLESPYDEGQAGELGDAVVTDDGQTAFDSIDGSGFLGGGSCPGIPVHTYMGRTFNFNSTICELGDAFAALVLVIAYAMAAGIVARAASGG